MYAESPLTGLVQEIERERKRAALKKYWYVVAGIFLGAAAYFIWLLNIFVRDRGGSGVSLLYVVGAIVATVAINRVTRFLAEALGDKLEAETENVLFRIRNDVVAMIVTGAAFVAVLAIAAGVIALQVAVMHLLYGWIAAAHGAAWSLGATVHLVILLAAPALLLKGISAALKYVNR